jgi:hypothetical protein
MIPFRAVAFILLASLALPASAEPVFLPGSRIGLDPPAGLDISKRFKGYENAAKATAITLMEMPPEAYGQLSAGLGPEALKAQGFELEGREELKVGGADAVLLTGTQAVGGVPVRKWLLIAGEGSMTGFVVAQSLPDGGYPDAAMREALRSIVFRPAIPLEDQIGALPFRLSDRAGFRPVRVMTGNSLLLTDGPQDVVRDTEQPILILAQSVQPAPRDPEARGAFARAALLNNNALTDLSVERAGPFRQGGAEWHEIVARGFDRSSKEPVVVVQTIRFGPGTYLRAVGVARAEAREAALPRFRKVVDGIEVD